MSRFHLLCVAMLLAAACGGGLPEVVTDTGYEGTWQRGNERVQSTFSIVEIEGEYRVRWGKTSDDGKLRVTCDWDGRCEEFVDGEKTSDYLYRAWLDESSGRLRLACRGTVVQPTPLEIDWVDELKLRDEGRVLRFIRIEDRVYRFDPARPPRRDYDKLSDFVADPPPGWTPPGA